MKEQTGARAALASMRQQLDQCMLRDRRRLLRTIDRIAARPRPPEAKEMARLESAVQSSLEEVAARRARVPAIHFDGSLPVHARRDVLARTINRSPVTIVSGATGSGKSTQLPKICLELGRGVTGMIAHTQPRRIAAQALANRISAETGTVCGDRIGYQVRFVDRTGPGTLVKLMTDGLLLRELERDPWLERYDTLIIDEAHERNLNVDFLLGVCQRLTRQRPELRIIVTSATIETDRFAEFFESAAVVDVEGRGYPIELRYRPLAVTDEDSQSLSDAVRAALDELAQSPAGQKGDALVFLPGERQIMDVRDQLSGAGAPGWDVLPLFARLSAQEQERIFAPHVKRRAILATNVAETSLTIPGIRFVIDSGLARVSRYSPRAKFQRLPIEPISRASADQRMGRCGREGEGICIRLYAEEDYQAREQYTQPEILRTNLASLILRMVALGLGTPEDFPFLDEPDNRLLNDGYRLLQELVAVDGDRRITRLGRHMAALPVDPRLARMLVEAGRSGCLAEALVIAAFLSIRDPRERPMEKREAADEKHALFADERSDFVAILNLWEASQSPSLASRREFRGWCKTHFLSYLRMREWQDLQGQLADIGIGGANERRSRRRNEAPGHDGARPVSMAVLHQAILTGFLGGMGVRDDDGSYLGARDTRFVIAPGTPLQRRKPRWVVAASLVETGRLYARTVAQVQPSWIESAAAHLVRRSYEDPEWIADRGMVMVRETVSLYGRVLSSGRRVNFASVDLPACRRIFVAEALVAGRSDLRYDFLERNASRKAQIEQLEARLRRRDLLAMDDALTEFYLARLPDDIASSRDFTRWWRQKATRDPHWLDAPDRVLLAREIPPFDARDYPDRFDVSGNALPLSYVFDPTREDDGVSLDVPALLLRDLDEARLSWLVPGLLEEKVTALLRALPKNTRRELVPIPAAARRFCDARAAWREGSLFAALAEFVVRETGMPCTAQDIAAAPCPAHLRMNLRVRDKGGKLLDVGRELAPLRRELRAAIGELPATSGAHDWHRDSVRRWDFGDIPEAIRVREAGVDLTMYPGLEDTGKAAKQRLFSGPAAAQRATCRGVVRLAALALPQQWSMVRQAAEHDTELRLLAILTKDGRQLFADIADRAISDAVLGDAQDPPRTQVQYQARLEQGRSEIVEAGERIIGNVRRTLLALKQLRGQLDAPALRGYPQGIQAITSQVERLIAPGWVRTVPAPWFERLAKYLQAAGRRAERMAGDRTRDLRLAGELARYQQAYDALANAADPDGPPAPELEQLRWMIEEFRLSLFAQNLRTLAPVSAKRLDEAVSQARREAGRA